MVAVDLARVPRGGCQAGERGEPGRGAEHGQVGSGGGEEVGHQPFPEPWDRHELTIEGMLCQARFDLRVQLQELVAQPKQVGGDRCHQRRGGGLTVDDGQLAVGDLERLSGELGRLPDALLLQPASHAHLPGPADRGRGLIVREQDQRSFSGGIVECAFQAGKVVQQQSAQPVDVPCPVLDQVSAALAEELELSSHVVRDPDGLQITADAGLVGDDRRVLRVGLRLAAICERGGVDDAAWDIAERLPVIGEHPLHQPGAAVVQIGRPEQLSPVCSFGDVAHQGQDVGFGVGEAARERCRFPSSSMTTQ